MNESSIDSYSFSMTAVFGYENNTAVKNFSVEEINFGKG